MRDIGGEVGGDDIDIVLDKDGEVGDDGVGGAIIFVGDHVSGIGVGDGTVDGDVDIVYSVSSGGCVVEKIRGDVSYGGEVFEMLLSSCSS
jgi:hypothetical protein